MESRLDSAMLHVSGVSEHQIGQTHDVFHGFGARGAQNSTFSIIFSFFQAPKEPPRDPPRDSPRTSGRCVRHYVFPIFVNLGGRRVQIGKFNNWGGLIIEGGGYF